MWPYRQRSPSKPAHPLYREGNRDPALVPVLRGVLGLRVAPRPQVQEREAVPLQSLGCFPGSRDWRQDPALFRRLVLPLEPPRWFDTLIMSHRQSPQSGGCAHAPLMSYCCQSVWYQQSQPPLYCPAQSLSY